MINVITLMPEGAAKDFSIGPKFPINANHIDGVREFWEDCLDLRSSLF